MIPAKSSSVTAERSETAAPAVATLPVAARAQQIVPERRRGWLERIKRYFGSDDPHPPAKAKYDGTYTFDKVTNVYNGGVIHEENQPAHLLIRDTEVCITRCTEEYGNPCFHFCPAQVYEPQPTADGRGKVPFLNFTNCFHCKTCDIMDPYQVITWVPPEGGGGPDYKKL